MSTPVYPIVSTAPFTVFRRQQTQESYNLYNTSPVATGPPIYLDDSPQAPGTTTGVPLYPGAQLSWEAGKECYAITPAGTTGQLTVSPNSGNYFDPFSLAVNLLTVSPGGSTLAQQIAQNIFITGAPPVDKMTQLCDVTFNQDGAFHFVPTLDVSGYQSVLFWFRQTDPAPAVATPPNQGTRVGFLWENFANNLTIGQDFFMGLGDNNSFTGHEFTSGRYICQGPKLFLTLEPPNNAGGTVRLVAYGSYARPARNQFYSLSGFYLNTAASVSENLGYDRYLAVLSPNLANGASVAPWIPVRDGKVTATFTYNAAPPANGIDFLVQVQDGTGLNPIAGVRQAGAGATTPFTAQQEFYLPARGVQVFLRNRGPAALVAPAQAMFTWES